MLLQLTHTTDLAYSEMISESIMELRMAPRQEQDQHRLSFKLSLGPAASVTSYFDWLGNTVHTFSIAAFHKSIRIVATSVVETDRAKAEVEKFADTWPMPEEDQVDYSLYDHLHFGGPIIDTPKLRELVDVLHPQPGMSLGELGLRTLHLINEKFTYKKGMTSAASPITDILDTGQGVCQDFTHLMIGIARAMKIPARYISGMVHPDGERYRGFSQTHAWCEMYFPSTGWIGFDPANNCIVGANFVKVAFGRDFRDVPPNKGLYRGNAKESIEVQVQSEVLPSVPSELAAERVEALSVPTYPAGHSIHREMADQQVEVHQQQQQQS